MTSSETVQPLEVESVVRPPYEPRPSVLAASEYQDAYESLRPAVPRELPLGIQAAKFSVELADNGPMHPFAY